MPKPKPRDLLTRKEAAEILGVSVKRIANLAATGELPSLPPQPRMFTRAAVAEYKKERRGPGRPGIRQFACKWSSVRGRRCVKWEYRDTCGNLHSGIADSVAGAKAAAATRSGESVT